MGGKIADTDVFNLLTRLILAKIHDERTTNNHQPYSFQILNNENLKITLNRIDDLYQKAMESRLNIPTSQSVRELGKGTDAQIKFAIEKISPLNLSKIAMSKGGQDLIGDFFERIIRTGFKQTKGQFFTHLNIVDFMVRVVGLKEWAAQNVEAGSRPPRVIDPSAGSGSFVIRSMLEMSRGLEELKLSDSDYSDEIESILSELSNTKAGNRWFSSYGVGLEINQDLGLAAQVNMLLHGDGASAVFAGPKHGDGLAPFAEYPSTCGLLANEGVAPDSYDVPVCESFDAVLTNPLFASEIPDDDLARYEKSLRIIEHSKKSEDLFCDRWFQLLKPGGRLAAVIPNSVLDSKRENWSRTWLLRYFWLRAVVSLPADAFYPHTSTKTSIIFAQKKTREESEHSSNLENIKNLESQSDIYLSVATYLRYKRTAKHEQSISRNDLEAIAKELEERCLWH